VKASGPSAAAIAAFEWRTTTRRLPFAATALLMALTGFGLSATAFGPAELRLNGAWSVAYSTGFLALASVFAATLLAAPALLRDVEHRMTEIVFSTAVTKRAYLLGRFAGALLATATVVLLGVAGLAAGAILVPHDPARLAPFDALPYLWAFLVLALPAVLLVSAFLFAVAAVTRSTPATYVAGVLLYLLYFVAALLADSPLLAGSGPQSAEAASLAALLDPFGLSAFLAETRYWTVAERNERLIPLAGTFLTSRLLCLGAAVAALAFAGRRFAFRVVAAPARGTVDGPAPAGEAPSRVPPPAVTAPGLPALGSAIRVELSALLRSGPLAALFALWIGYLAIETVQTFRSRELGTALVPTAGHLVTEVATSLNALGVLFLVFFAAEVAFRERLARVSEVVDATPASSALFLVAKLAALSAVLAALAATGLGTGLAVQAAVGHFAFEPLAWASLLGISVLPLVLLAVLVLLIQALVPNRHVGLVLSLAAIAFLHRGALGGPDHPLLRYAYAPRFSWSDFSGFSPRAESYAWFLAWWTSVALLVGLLAWGLWPRGTDARLARRLAALRARWGRSGRRAALGAAALALAIGGLAFRGTNVTNRWESEDDLLAWKAAYETTYRPRIAAAQPVAAHLDADLDLEPAGRRLRVRGRSRLENRSAEAIGSVWVAVRRDVRVAALTLGGAAPSEVDETFATRRFALPRPMAPGASLDLAFDLLLERRAPSARGGDLDVVPNGSYVLGLAALPSVGYRRSWEIADPGERRRAGLPERGEEDDPDADLPEAPDRMTFDVRVTTPSDQLAVAPGVLVSSAVADGRRTTRFRAERPVRSFFAFASARYDVERVRHGGIDVEVYAHPSHRRNVGRILEAATAALDHGVARYGPYPFPQLRIAEVPDASLNAGGFALPGVVFLAERRGVLIDAEAPGRVDLLAKRVAHEVSHQWWGHQLDPADGPGATALVESLARHTELRVLKALRGAAALRPVLDFELERYLSGRTAGGEVPLVDVGRQPWLYYAKGSLAMAALSEIAGEEAVDRALGELLANANATGRPPSSRDLLARLLAVTPAADRPLVEEWWTRAVLHDVRLSAATARREPDGRFRVDVALEARSVETTGDGERDVPFDADVEVAVLPAGSGRGAGVTTPLHSARHRVRGSTRLSILVEGRPGEVVVDPRRLLLDRDRADDSRDVEDEPRGGVTPAFSSR